MKALIPSLALAAAACCTLLSLPAHAADAASAPAAAPMAGGCEAKAAEKKLAGAAKNSFVKKCEKDGAGAGAGAANDCAAKAAEKKLAGAAKSSFVKKCTADAAK